MTTGVPAALPLAIGPYRPVRKLGQGGMGVVYAAEDSREPGRIVALKVVAWTGEGKGDDPARRFVREAKILESLRHPNIVSFFEVGSRGQEAYFAMELVEGLPLTVYIGRPWPQLVPLLVQVCEGMEYLGAHAIVHRDLSLDNILIAEKDGRPVAKILDFGVAKDTAREETLHNFTKTGLIVGKPQYWSPESIGILGPGEKVDWRSDVYTLGVIFFRVFSGRFPFVAESPFAYIDLHVRHLPGELTVPEGCPPVPPAIAALVQRMLAKKRDARPQSYEEIVSVLLEALDSAPEELRKTARSFVVLKPSARDATTGTIPSAGIRRAPPLPGAEEQPTVRADAGHRKRPARHLRLPLTASLLGLAALGTAGVLLWRGRPPRENVAPAREARPAGTGGVVGAAAPGRLALQSVPWGRIVSVTDERDGRRLPLPGEPTTPLVLELPPSRYRIEIASSEGTFTEGLSVEIRSGEAVARSIVFIDSGKALDLLE